MAVTERPFAMGFTPFPFDATEEAVRATDSYIALHGDLVTHHFDDGVPWVEALDGRSFHPSLLADWERRRRLSEGKRVFLALTPLDGGRRDLAKYRGEKDNLPLPDSFRGKALDDPAVKRAYLAYCERAVEHFRPDWLAIGIEVNELILNSPDRWPAYLALDRETRAALKKRWPALPICATVTLHALTDPSKKDRSGQREKVRELLERDDFAGLSYHPFLVGNLRRPEEPLDWVRSWTSKPIAIAESGFPAETVRFKTLGIALESDPALQEAFIEKLLTRAGRDRYLFVTYFLHRDYDALWERIQALVPELFVAWRDCGLLDEAGAERPAARAWDRWLALPRRSR